MVVNFNQLVMYRYITIFILLNITFFTWSTPGNKSTVMQNNRMPYTVYVVQSMWHTGIILKTGDINSDIWPEIVQYSNKMFVDIGWGDEKFYQSHGNPPLLAARAILWPTNSILEIYSFNNNPSKAYQAKARILKINVTEQQLNDLCLFIVQSFLRNESGQSQLSRLYKTNSRFFMATRKYHLFRTCNTWIALAFKKSGFKVRSCCVLNANQLFRQLKKINGAEFINQN